MSLKKILIIYAIAVILQVTVVGFFPIMTVTPNLVFCITLVIAFMYEGGFRCLPIAMVSQLIVDIYGGIVIGVGVLSLFLSIAVVVAVRSILNVERLAPLIVTGVVAIFINVITYFGIIAISGVNLGIASLFMKMGIYIIYDLIVLTILFVFMIRKARNYSSRYSI